MPTPAHPLVLEPILKPKVWGGRRLAALGKALPPGETVGESWEVADLAGTSVSGGGGAAARSVIAQGSMKGRTLHEAMDAWGADLLGDAEPTRDGGFPLLVKYLDAREHLSIQVHPSPAYAAEHPEAHLKTESWLVIDAEPGAELFVGLRAGATRDDLARAVADGTVPDLMRRRPAVPGACHTLPSGTVHALGAGVLVAEVQTPSDTTFRVYDWTREYGRPERELHLKAALASASYDEPPEQMTADGRRGVVAATDFYTMELVRGHCSTAAVGGDGPVVVMLPRTRGASVASRSGRFQEVMLERGQTCVIPASCVGDAELRCGPETEAVLARVC